MPILTAVLAFLAGGIVVAATGHNPWTAYQGIWDGAGFNWLFHIPWDTNTIHLDAFNLSQTLLTTTTLILTGLAVAFPFRCGLFNIGGQGQYLVGLIVANWIGVDFASWPTLPHVLLGIVAADVRGRGLGGHRRLPEGDDRRARGDLDDHAQLDRDLGRPVPVRAGRPAAEHAELCGAGVGHDRPERAHPGLLGQLGAAGPRLRLLRRDRRRSSSSG